jgi:hypothetical protein
MSPLLTRSAVWISRVGIYGSAVVTGVGVGFLYNQVSRHIEVALVFPALAGLFAGAVIALAAKATYLSGTRHALLAGLLAGALAYGCSFWFDYGEFRADLGRVGGAGGTLPTAQIDRIETELLGSPGLPAYLSARARYGGRAVGISGAGGTGLPANLQWLLWLGEIGLAGYVGGVITYIVPRNYGSTGRQVVVIRGEAIM